MKMVENWLLLPVLVLYGWSLTGATSTLDIHIHDTYFVLDKVSILRILGSFLLIVFGLYKTIRYRHETINRNFAVPHILLTVLLTGLLLIPVETEVQFVDYSTWHSYERKMFWSFIGLISFLLVQFIFLIYFIVQLVRQPVNHS